MAAGRKAAGRRAEEEQRRSAYMVICGLNKTTLLDYPEHVAATVFTGGCNFRCPYCHNSTLVLCPGGQPVISEEEVILFLKKRRGVLEGVCITGGEPTLQEGLEEFIFRVRETGCLVKLDTNGYRPEVLEGLFKKKLLDYVAMDVKSSRQSYEKAAGVRGIDLSLLEESVDIIKNSGISHEFRTTVVKGIHKEEDIEAIGEWLQGSLQYVLQSYRENENVIEPGFAAFESGELKTFAAIARKYIDNVRLRGVE